MALTDEQYRKLLAYEVAEQLRADSRYRWTVLMSIGVPVIIAVAGLGVRWYWFDRPAIQVATEQAENASEEVRIFEDTLAIDDLVSSWSDPTRLEIEGRGFQEQRGIIELHYEWRVLAANRPPETPDESTIVVLFGDQIVTWGESADSGYNHYGSKRKTIGIHWKRKLRWPDSLSEGNDRSRAT